jgi:hypothetical protein
MQMGISMKVDIVGLGLAREFGAKNQLNCIASASGGKYYDANSAADLIEGISQSVSKAISGRIISHPKQPLQNATTPQDVNAPIPTNPQIKNGSSSYVRDESQPQQKPTTIIVPPDTSILDKLLSK